MIWFVVGLGLGVLATFLVTRHPAEPTAIETDAEPEPSEGVEASAEAQRLAAVVRVLPIGVVIVDAAGEVSYRNDVAAGFASGRHSDAIVDGRIRELAAAALQGRASEDDLDLYGPPRRFLEFRANPIVEPGDPRPTSAVILILDATEERRTEVVRRDFVANVSHELKTPVGAIGVLAETLHGTDDPEVVSRLAGRLQRESLRLGSTIDDLLTLSSIEGGERVDHVEIPIRVVIESTLERVAPVAERRGVEIVVDRSIDDAVIGDERQLVSALANLVENAVKYSEPESTVELAATAAGSMVGLAVRDRGRGIPERDLERIFERFYRVDPARSRETGGTGLGLSIVRNIVLAHGGTVGVQSVEGEGSTFTMRLPRASHPGEVTEAGGSTSTIVGGS